MRPETFQELVDAPYDDIIDVRSPAEFAEDHLPGAINLPVLDDAERAEVGTLYVRHSRFDARRIGAGLVARNTAHHLETALKDKSPAYRPLVYCWRGGQRSNAFATILKQIGWQVDVLEGGYKTYRSLVWNDLYHAPFPCPILLLNGYTGTGKTELLARLHARSHQVIDLEALARHRGSLFGSTQDDQPTQKAFESSLAAAIAVLDPGRPVIIEAESSKIGDRTLPPSLLAAMRQAPHIVLNVPIEERAKFIVRAYADVTSDAHRLQKTLENLRPYHVRECLDAWLEMAARREFEQLASELMEHHYDPRYANDRNDRQILATVKVPALDNDQLDAAADRLGAIIRAWTPAPFAQSA